MHGRAKARGTSGDGGARPGLGLGLEGGEAGAGVEQGRGRLGRKTGTVVQRGHGARGSQKEMTVRGSLTATILSMRDRCS